MFERVRQGTVEIIRGDVPLNAEGGDQLRKVMGQVRESGRRNIVLDVRKVPLINSAGLSLLLDLNDELRSQGGCLKLLAPNPLVAEILHVTGVEQYFETFPDEVSAVGSFTR